MPLITLAEAKANSRIEDTIEDGTLQAMVTTAIEYVMQATNLTDQSTAPSMAKSAALLVFSDLYENREAQTDRPLTANRTVSNLINMARDYQGWAG